MTAFSGRGDNFMTFCFFYQVIIYIYAIIKIIFDYFTVEKMLFADFLCKHKKSIALTSLIVKV